MANRTLTSRSAAVESGGRSTVSGRTTSMLGFTSITLNVCSFSTSSSGMSSTCRHSPCALYSDVSFIRCWLIRFPL